MLLMPAAAIAIAWRCLLALTASAMLNLLAGRVGAAAHGAVRVAAGVLAAATLVIPFFVDAPPIFRLLVSHIVALHALRTLEIIGRSRAERPFGPRERIVRVLLPFETTLMKRVPRKFMTREMALGSLRIAVGAGLLFLAARLVGPTTPYALVGWPRWLVTGVGAYFVFDGSADHMTALVAAFGWSHPPFHRAPIRARTLAELWGSRWNLIVSHGFKVNVFMPLARRRMGRLGLFASFVASAALHVYFFAAAVGMTMSLYLGSLFVAHGLLVLLEAGLGLKHRSPILGHAYVVASFVITVPLFAEPAQRAIGL